MVMIIATIIMVSGPFANFIMPIMIGAKDMAFPRLNAMSFWVVVSAVPCLLSTFFLGGVNAGWTTYAPLSVQAPPAMDAFAITIIVFVVSVTVAGVNTIVTVVTMRAKGMTMGRLPIFTWGAVIGSALGLYAMPAFLAVMTMMITDRATGTSFFVPQVGGAAWLYENIFWIMGHPEVYVILLPPVAAVLEIASTFARKPVFGYKVAVAAFVAIAALSIMVWAHHMFTTGWAPNLAAPFMLTTELISIPTGIIFLCTIGTMWKGSIWMRLPMWFVYLFIWNFIIGGVTGIYLSDVPADQFFHGDMFVTAHFHYTLLGGAMIGATAAVCYWFPKVSGRMLNERIGKVAFWLIAIGIQVTYFGMFWEGFQGMARRIAYYNPHYEVGQPDGDRRCLHPHGRLAGVPLHDDQQLAAREARPGQSLVLQDARVEGAHPGAARELPGGPRRHLGPVHLRRRRARRPGGTGHGPGGRTGVGARRSGTDVRAG